MALYTTVMKRTDDKGETMQTKGKKITKYLVMKVTRYGNKVLEVLSSQEEARKVLYEYKTFYIDNMTPLYIKRVSVR